jgi:uncharacterized protein YndB with AHSA1/START domain
MTKIIIKRTFPGTLTEIWAKFTEPDHLKKWWAPEGFKCPIATIDLREGGLFHFCFEDSDGNRSWTRGIYQQIIPTYRFSYLDSFADEEGNAVPPSHYGLPGDEIEESFIEFKFQEDGVNTHMTVEMEGVDDPDYSQMVRDGWNQMFDRLDRIIA